MLVLPLPHHDNNLPIGSCFGLYWSKSSRAIIITRVRSSVCRYVGMCLTHSKRYCWIITELHEWNHDMYRSKRFLFVVCNLVIQDGCHDFCNDYFSRTKTDIDMIHDIFTIIFRLARRVSRFKFEVLRLPKWELWRHT